MLNGHSVYWHAGHMMEAGLKFGRPGSSPLNLPLAGAAETRGRPRFESRSVLAWQAIPWWPVLAFGLPFLLYGWTLAPTIYNLDSAELSTAAATGGIVRATGYPLYLLLGRLWSLLPWADVGARMNLFSAFCGAGTILLAERILHRWGVGGWARLGALGLLATSTFFWAMSLVAEVYTLHTLLMAGLILLALRWQDRPSPGRLAALAGLTGLSLGHHAATVLLLPGLALFLWMVDGRTLLSPRKLLPAGLAFLAGLSIYLYLPWLYLQAPAFNYAGTYDGAGVFHALDLRRPENLWWLVSGRAFQGSMLGYQGAELWAEVRAFGLHLWRAVLAVGIGPGILGLMLLLRRDRPRGLMLLMMFLCSAAFYIDYRVVDKETMFLPTYLVWALWTGIGLQALLNWIGDDSVEAETWRGGSRLLRGAILASVAASLALNLGQVSLRGDRSARDRGERILATVEPGARLIGSWETVPLIEYLQLVEGHRPDVSAINRFLIPHESLLALARAEVGQRPFYLESVPIELTERYRVCRAGLLHQLHPETSSNEGAPCPSPSGIGAAPLRSGKALPASLKGVPR